MNYKMTKKDRVHFCTLLIISGIIFGYFLSRGVVIQTDSQSYLTMNNTREPVYPIFLYLFRIIFSENKYLTAVCVFQALFAIITVTCFTTFITKTFSLKYWCSFIVIFLVSVPYWIGTIWFQPYVLVTNQIMTEGITVSIYYWFILCLLRAIFTRKINGMIPLIAVNVILVLTRSQMFTCMGMSCIAFLYIAWKQKIRIWVRGILIIIIGITLIKSLNSLYFYELTGKTQTSYMNQLTLLSNILYSSDKEDSKLFKDKDIQYIYHETYKLMIEKGVNHIFNEEEGLIANGDLIAESHDVIKYEIISDVFKRYHNGSDVFINRGIVGETRDIISTMNKTLLQDNYKEWLRGIVSMLPKGFMRTIFLTSNSIFIFCAIYSCIAYLIFFSMLLGLFMSKGKIKTVLFGGIMLLLIIINVGGIAITIFELSRYLIYNTGLFYLAGILMLTELPIIRKIACKEDKNQEE